jgi:hypothetical protein
MAFFMWLGEDVQLLDHVAVEVAAAAFDAALL